MSKLLAGQKQKLLAIINEMDRPEEIKDRLKAVASETNEDTWDNAYSIVVGQGKTLWQSILLIDPSFTRTGPSTSHSGKVLKGWPQVPEVS